LRAFTLADLTSQLEIEDAGREMHRLIRELYPICRSVTGNGVRETLGSVRRSGLPLELHEVPTGTKVLDWVIPREWNVREAWLRGPDGQLVADFARSNLELVGYSVPMRAKLSLAELRPHLHALPEQPDWIPFRTSVYREDWGFCLAQRKLDALREGEYEVCIDATLAPGHLTWGEARLRGATSDEILLSSHVCHPSLCNDNLSGIALLALLGRYLARVPHRHAYRILMAPVTIGAIAWLAEHEKELARIRHGLVVTLVGDPGQITYKKSRRGDAPIDRALAHVLGQRGSGTLREFDPFGYDERQFCSPGFDLPVGCLMRTPHAEFPEYHTSADDTAFVKPEALADSLEALLAALDVLEHDGCYRNLAPKGEPQLGRRGVLGSAPWGGPLHRAVTWVLNLSDGRTRLLEIAERARLPFAEVHEAARVLVSHDLLARMEG
jgi:aminopeptidase-like protein